MNKLSLDELSNKFDLKSQEWLAAHPRCSYPHMFYQEIGLAEFKEVARWYAAFQGPLLVFSNNYDKTLHPTHRIRQEAWDIVLYEMQVGMLAAALSERSVLDLDAGLGVPAIALQRLRTGTRVAVVEQDANVNLRRSLLIGATSRVLQYVSLDGSAEDPDFVIALGSLRRPEELASYVTSRKAALYYLPSDRNNASRGALQTMQDHLQHYLGQVIVHHRGFQPALFAYKGL